MVLLQLAGQLRDMGRLGGVLYWERPPEGRECEGLPWVQASRAKCRVSDVYIVPEGWPNALALGFRAGCRCVVYCQNWAYLFHGLGDGVHWRDLPVEFWAVSDPVAWHMEQVLGTRPPIVRPAIDPDLFLPAPRRLDEPPRIAFMPRKNSALAGQVRRIFEERNPGVAVEWVAIDGLRREQVAERLRQCAVFLVTGFPEGCPLPPLEAMSCGCLCAGFTGFGGWEYMRQMEADFPAPHRYALREVPWGGNGWWVADGDVLGAALGLERALATWRKNPEETRFGGAWVREAYSSCNQQRELAQCLTTRA